MKIGIIGFGFVGKTFVKVFKEYFEVSIYDKFKEDYKNPEVLNNSEIIFICVPTPMMESGEIDLSIIHESMELLSSMKFKEKPLIVIRSTVVPGTVDSLKEKYDFEIISNPEFLREKTAVEDFKKSNRIVIGADKIENSEKLESLYKIISPNIKYVKVDSKTAEMIKYASNVTLSGQIAIANEIYQICKVLGVDYDIVREALLCDSRIGRNIEVPGHDGNFGFGGKCLPKDLNALIYLLFEKGYNPKLLREIWELNKRIRKNKDWENIPGATSQNKDFWVIEKERKSKDIF
ncbi:MAG: nucleotide sugar dehydrogenase [Nanoarchaeota archaeon]|nr:nucleotide sugar dehydrogenase [Nanoarchaeota archaeon]